MCLHVQHSWLTDVQVQVIGAQKEVGLPVICRSNKWVWMTKELNSEWFNNLGTCKAMVVSDTRNTKKKCVV